MGRYVRILRLEIMFFLWQIISRGQHFPSNKTNDWPFPSLLCSLAWESESGVGPYMGRMVGGLSWIGPAGYGGVECAITIMYIEKAHCIDMWRMNGSGRSVIRIFSLGQATLPKFTRWASRVVGWVVDLLLCSNTIDSTGKSSGTSTSTNRNPCNSKVYWDKRVLFQLKISWILVLLSPHATAHCMSFCMPSWS